MAVTVTKNAGLSGVHHEVYDIIATANGDTAATINHGLGLTPKSLNLNALNTAYYTSTWVETSRSSTQVVVTKVGTGGGNANAQIRVEIAKPHSIVD
jgi:hypothetical protein